MIIANQLIRSDYFRLFNVLSSFGSYRATASVRTNRGLGTTEADTCKRGIRFRLIASLV